MEDLINYIVDHTSRGECQCGVCIDKGPDREAPSHSVDLHFFWVSAREEPSASELRELLRINYPDLDRLQGGSSYIELGGILGDQGIALRLIGLGHLLGLWQALTPESMGMTGSMADQMAGMGMVNIGPWTLDFLGHMPEGNSNGGVAMTEEEFFDKIEAVTTIINPGRARLLADWLDVMDGMIGLKGETGVQDDLRRLAVALEALGERSSWPKFGTALDALEQAMWQPTPSGSSSDTAES